MDVFTIKRVRDGRHGWDYRDVSAFADNNWAVYAVFCEERRLSMFQERYSLRGLILDVQRTFPTCAIFFDFK